MPEFKNHLFEVAKLMHSFCLKEAMPIFAEAFRKTPREIGEKFREGMGAEYVSDLDLELQKRWIAFLAPLFPGEQMVGEESEGDPWPIQNGWVIDPVDGTHNSLAGLPIFGTMLAHICEGIVDSSFVFLPAEEILAGKGLLFAGRSIGAFAHDVREPQPLRVSKTAALKDAFFIFEGPTKSVLASPLAQRAMHAVRRYRNGLSSCWSGSLIAMGGIVPAGFDALICCNAKPWDTLPIALLIEEARGKVTDHGGNPWGTQNYADLVFSNGLLHKQILALKEE